MHIPVDHDHLTFSQREGKVPLPAPMKLESLSRKFRLRIARLITNQIRQDTDFYADFYGFKHKHMSVVLADYCCEVEEFFSEPENRLPSKDRKFIQERCKNSGYHEVLTLIEFMLRHEQCPDDLWSRLIEVFEQPPLVAYHVQKLNGQLTIIACADAESGLATQQALSVVEDVGPEGAREHFRKAANSINEAKYKDSVRDSIHAMEAVVLTIDPNFQTLGQALKRLERTGFLAHGAINKAFESLYGYTSDENGIRHALTEEDSPNVGLDEAMFMFSTCAAGAAYLVKKHADGRNSP
ncbi:MAG: hypothetical protein OXI87_04955 [Albidovulum sp.]|nr:hypothetical protein [Albidovulum sp.]